jgi:hypothetical protein
MEWVGETHENVVYRVMDDTEGNHSSGRPWKTLSRHAVPEVQRLVNLCCTVAIVRTWLTAADFSLISLSRAQALVCDVC